METRIAMAARPKFEEPVVVTTEAAGETLESADTVVDFRRAEVELS
jgi:hypothetical protein